MLDVSAQMGLMQGLVVLEYWRNRKTTREMAIGTRRKSGETVRIGMWR